MPFLCFNEALAHFFLIFLAKAVTSLVRSHTFVVQGQGWQASEAGCEKGSITHTYGKWNGVNPELLWS